MARLPDGDAVGAPGSYNSGRGIASYDVTPLARGAKDLAQGAQQLGNSMMNVGISKLNEEQRATTELGSARADANWMTDRINLNKEVADASDPEALSGVKDKFKASLERAAQNIPEGPQRDLWMTKRQSELATADVAVQNRTFSINRDRSLAEDQETLRIMSEQAATASPEDRKIIEGTASRIFQGWKDNGYVDEQKIASARQAWANGYAVTTIQALPPRERIEALTPVKLSDRSKTAYEFYVSKGWSPPAAAGIVGGLIHEGGLNTTARNPGDGSDGSDSIGIAQWNSGRAQQLKQFAAAQGKDWHDFGVQLAFVDHELRTSEKAAGDELGRATSARGAAEAFVRYERPKNFEKGATAAHGWGNRLRQAEGVFASYGGGKLPPARGEDMAGFITPDQKRSIVTASERELATQYQERQLARASDRSQVRSLLPDDQSSIMSTGKPIAELTTQRVSDALGPAAGEEFQRGRALASEVYDASSSFTQMPSAQIQAQADRLRPTEADGGSAYADRTFVYKAVRERADAILTQRSNDPAASVEDLPAVAAARSNLAQQDTRENREALIQARLTTQEAVGIPGYVRSPIPVAEAKQYAAMMRPLAKGQADAVDQGRLIEGIVGDIQNRYGKFTPDVLKQVLYQVTLKRDAADVLADAIGRMTKTDAGPIVPTDGARRVEIADRADEIANAAGAGSAPPSNPSGDYMNELPDERWAPTFRNAAAELRSDPERLLPFFIQRYGADRVPADVRERMNAKAGMR